MIQTETKPKLNVKLLRKIQKAIMATPHHFDMDYWAGMGVEDIAREKKTAKGKLNAFQKLAKEWKKDPAPYQCDTTACIAGWAVALASREEIKPYFPEVRLWENVNSQVSSLAPLILGIENKSVEGEADDDFDPFADEIKVKDTLFRTGFWPIEMRRAYREAEQNEDFAGMAKAACDRIDAFIKEYAPEEA